MRPRQGRPRPPRDDNDAAQARRYLSGPAQPAGGSLAGNVSRSASSTGSSGSGGGSGGGRGSGGGSGGSMPKAVGRGARVPTCRRRARPGRTRRGALVAQDGRDGEARDQ